MSLASKIGAGFQDDITPRVPSAAKEPPPSPTGATKKLLVQVDMETHILLKVIAARSQKTLEAVCREGLEAFAKSQS